MTIGARLETLNVSIADRLRALRLVVFDFDGVFTDNAVHVHEDGTETVRCVRSDGLGLQLLAALGVGTIILSSETNPVVAARCRKLSVRCIQGSADKRTALDAIAAESGVSLKETAFVGNDINDLECLKAVGLPIVVADAHEDVVAYAMIRTNIPGGYGAVREVCDLIAAAKRT